MTIAYIIVFGIIFLALGIFDMVKGRIPHVIAWPAAGLALLWNIIWPVSTWYWSLAGIVLGFGLFLVLKAFGRFGKAAKPIGGGDLGLMALVGAVFGLWLAVCVMGVAFIVSAVWGFSKGMTGVTQWKEKTAQFQKVMRENAVPLAPPVCLVAVVSLFILATNTTSLNPAVMYAVVLLTALGLLIAFTVIWIRAKIRRSRKGSKPVAASNRGWGL